MFSAETAAGLYLEGRLLALRCLGLLLEEDARLQHAAQHHHQHQHHQHAAGGGLFGGAGQQGQGAAGRRTPHAQVGRWMAWRFVGPCGCVAVCHGARRQACRVGPCRFCGAFEPHCGRVWCKGACAAMAMRGRRGGDHVLRVLRAWAHGNGGAGQRCALSVGTRVCPGEHRYLWVRACPVGCSSVVIECTRPGGATGRSLHPGNDARLANAPPLDTTQAIASFVSELVAEKDGTGRQALLGRLVAVLKVGGHWWTCG